MNKKQLDKAAAYLANKTMNRKGLDSQLVVGVSAFAIGVLTLVFLALIIVNLQASNPINNNVSSPAWVIGNNTLGMILNFSAQLPLAGLVFGFCVIFVGLALIGFYAYNRYQGGRR